MFPGGRSTWFDISGRAETLRSSESAVADAISGMERGLGTELFRRQRSRGATLTSDGLTVLPLARKMLADGAELTSSVGRDVSTIAGPVRIGCLNTLASHVLPRLIVEVGQRFPGIDIEYQIDDFATTLQELESADLDLVVAFDNVVPPQFESMTIATTEPMLPSRTRLSGVSISYAMGAIIGGAFAPTIAQYLVGATGWVGTVGVYLTIMAVISGIAVLTIREPRGNPLTPQQEADVVNA